MNYVLKNELNSENRSLLVKSLMQNLSNESVKLRNVDPLNELCISAIDLNNTFIAGIIGYIFYGSLLIDMLWVDPDYRNKGIGEELVLKIEDISKEFNTKFSIVTSMDWWNTRNFYEKLGYKIEFERKGYQNNSSLYSFIKQYSQTNT